ncbi:hypothetical protein DIPPA_06649 [Diplonema papillatum]|nr:hypothetical protein DIPPA_06649 [Diplonema papillatum]
MIATARRRYSGASALVASAFVLVGCCLWIVAHSHVVAVHSAARRTRVKDRRAAVPDKAAVQLTAENDRRALPDEEAEELAPHKDAEEQLQPEKRRSHVQPGAKKARGGAQEDSGLDWLFVTANESEAEALAGSHRPDPPASSSSSEFRTFQGEAGPWEAFVADIVGPLLLECAHVMHRRAQAGAERGAELSQAASLSASSKDRSIEHQSALAGSRSEGQAESPGARKPGAVGNCRLVVTPSVLGAWASRLGHRRQAGAKGTAGAEDAVAALELFFRSVETRSAGDRLPSVPLWCVFVTHDRLRFVSALSTDPRVVGMYTQSEVPPFRAQLRAARVDSRFVFLKSDQHDAVTRQWYRSLESNMTALGFELLPVDPAKQPLRTTAATLRTAAGIVATYGNPRLPLAVLAGEGAVVVLLSPGGVTESVQYAAERLFVLARMPIVNHKAIRDSVQRTSSARFTPDEPFSIARDEVPKLCAEILLLLDAIDTRWPTPAFSSPQNRRSAKIGPLGLARPSDAPTPDPTESPDAEIENAEEELGNGATSGSAAGTLSGFTRVDWLVPKTKYDSGHFAFGPFSVGLPSRDDDMVIPSGASVDGSGLVTIHNRTELRAPRALFSAAPDASRPEERLPPGAFGYYRENDKHHYPVPVRYTTRRLALAACDHVVKETVHFHYPWVRDNIYHSHNDNFWPLFLSALAAGDAAVKRAVVFLATKRGAKPLPAFAEIVQRHFTWSTTLDGLPSLARSLRPGLAGGTVCFERGVWGRPKRLFSTYWKELYPYAQWDVVRRWRATVYDWYSIPLLAPNARLPQPTWIERKQPKRVLSNEGDLFAEFDRLARAEAAKPLGRCCQGMSFAEQVGAISRTDILFGTHGAGLLHIVFLRRGSVVAHLSPRRLNYHEQTIIERLAFASDVFYTNTHLHTPPSQAGEWNSDRYTIPTTDVPLVVSQAYALWLSRRP